MLKVGGKLYSVLTKNSGYGLQTANLDEDEVQLALKNFKSVEINYSSRTSNYGTEVFSNYLIEALK